MDVFSKWPRPALDNWPSLIVESVNYLHGVVVVVCLWVRRCGNWSREFGVVRVLRHPEVRLASSWWAVFSMHETWQVLTDRRGPDVDSSSCPCTLSLRRPDQCTARRTCHTYRQSQLERGNLCQGKARATGLNYRRNRKNWIPFRSTQTSVTVMETDSRWYSSGIKVKL